MSRKEILEKLIRKEIGVDEALNLLSTNKIEEVDEIVKYDLFREKRTGIPEIVYAETKTPETVVRIAKQVLLKKKIVLLSRLTEKHVENIEEERELFEKDNFKINFGTAKKYCLIKHKEYEYPKNGGRIGIITAGTSDIPVAEEAKVVAEMMGSTVYMEHDVGVAGIHRLFHPLNDLLAKDVKVIIVAAGMEGALPTVIAGLVDIPVIGLPISTGYGFGGKGKAALSSMLQSCALGIAVVNIDAGVSAGAIAAKIASVNVEPDLV